MTDALSISRRHLLGGAAVAAALLVAPPLVSGVASERVPLALGQISLPGRSAFEALVGSRFVTSVEGAATTAVLTAVRDLHPVEVGNDEQRFGLVFALRASKTVEDGIRAFSHADLGTVDLFVTGAVPRLGVVTLEAVIDRR
jgi:hypothetical protein